MVGSRKRSKDKREEKMRNSKRSGVFLLCFFNMLMNIEGLLPSVVLLVLHFAEISVWWSVAHSSRGFYI